MLLDKVEPMKRLCSRLKTLCLLAIAAASFGHAQIDASLRLAHFSPDAPQLDLVVNNTLVIKDIAYADVSAYISLEQGEYELKVYPHRAPEPFTETELDADEQVSSKKVTPLVPFTLNVNLVGGKSYTLLAAGFFNPPPPDDELGDLEVIAEGSTTIDIVGPGGFSQTFVGTKQLRDLLPGSYIVAASEEGYESIQYTAEVSANTEITLPITLKESTVGETAATEVESVATALQETTRDPDWQRVQLHLYEDKPPESEDESSVLRFIHASPVTPSVDLSTEQKGDEPNVLLTNLGFPNESDLLETEAGLYTLRLSSSGQSDSLIELTDLTLEPGINYTFYIVGSLSDSFINIIPKVDRVRGRP